MTRRITLFVGAALVALTVVAPALGEGRLAGSPEPQATHVSRPDSHDVIRTTETTTYLDAADRARRIDVIVPTAMTDAFERSAPPKGPQPTLTVSGGSGDGVEWSQLGLGFGLGLILAGGLMLVMRATRVRPLAH